MLKKTALLACTFLCVFFFAGQSSFAQTTFKSGSAIIDMGSATPTVKNSLKPYGLIYALLKNNHVPVNYVVNPLKAKDGIDFVYNGKAYKGGTFIISGEYITSAVQSVLTNWTNQGVLIDYTNASGGDLTVTVTTKTSFVPKWVMDKTNGNIAVAFLTAAGIPASAYSFKNPADLGQCDDLFVLPHADPTWATHSNLLDWNKDFKGAIWAGCHAVSVLENLFDPANPTTRKMNFLTTSGMIPFTDHNTTSTPFSNLLPGDPVAQYVGKTDNAQIAGSETVYLPKSGGAWNAGAKLITTSPGQIDIPSLSPGAAVENVYGRAFDDVTRGYVAYQASHNIGGTSTEQIAAQRIFFNFSMLALNDKIPPIISVGLGGFPVQFVADGTASINGLTATVTGTGVGVTYQWSASVPGTFTGANTANATFKPDAVTASTPCVITCVVSESCGRVSFDAKSTTLIPPVSSHVITGIDITKSIDDACSQASLSFNVFDGNADPDGGNRTLLNVTGLANGTVITSTNGTITFTAAANFKGQTTGTYTITNGSQTSAAKNITINVGDATQTPALTADNASALVDQVTEINVLGNDKNTAAAANGNALYIRDIVTKPAKGYAYINSNGNVSYLTTKDLSSTAGGDSFQYLACNSSTGYCAVATVTVTLVADACPANQYNTSSTGTNTVAVFNPTADSYINQATAPTDSTSTNFSSLPYLRINGGTNNNRKIVMNFTLTGIPTTATVNSAVLSMSLYSSLSVNVAGTNNPFPASVYGITRSTFTPAQATWLKFAGGTSDTWAAAGMTNGTGDPDLVDVDGASPPFDRTGGFANSTVYPVGTLAGATVTSIVKAMVLSGSGNSYGIAVVPRSGAINNNVNFVSNEGLSSLKPTLSVDYTVRACSNIPANYAPVVYPDAVSTSSALSVTFSPMANDLNYYGNGNTLASVSNPAHGTATINGNQIVYTPAGNFVGTDTLTYTVNDLTAGSSSTATVRITVSRVAPTVLDDVASTLSNTSKTIVVGANDVDAQGAMTAPTITTQARNGTITVVGNDIVYTPAAGFVGTDYFQYSRKGQASDVCSVALSGTATVTVTVTNQPPTSGNGTINTFACVTGVLNVLPLSADPESGTLSVTISSAPSHGSAIANADGTVSFIPTTSYVGSDVFSYTVTDPYGSVSALAGRVTVNISGSPNPNIAPVAVADSDSTLMNQPVYSNVISNDSDPNSDKLSINISAPGLTAPSHGTIQLMPNKLIKYTPNSGYVGTDTYQYQLTDTHPDCSGSGSLNAVATVTINIKPIPTTLAGTVWNDADHSANNTFTNIQNGAETGTNGNGTLYVYVVDNNKKVVDRTPVDIDGTYLLSSVPSATSNLTLMLSAADVTVGSTLPAGSVPNGYVNSTPLTNTLPNPTPSTSMTGYDWGIYINATLTPGTIIGPSTVCSSSAVPGTFTSTSNATGGNVNATGYQYQWQVSIDNGVTFGNIVGATETSYTPSAAITTTSNYRRLVSTNLDPRVVSNTITVTYVASPTVSIAPLAATIATGGNAGLTATGADLYSWSPSTGLSASNVSGVTATPAATTLYTVTGTLSPSGCTGTATVNVVVINPGSISADQNNCGPYTPNTFASAADASGTAGITYQWQSSTDNITFSNIVGATANTYTPSSAITVTTYYRRAATGGGNTYNSNVVTATVKAVPATGVTPTGIALAAGVSATLTANGADSYAWTPATGLSATTGVSVIATPTSTTVYRVTGTLNTTGCTSSATVTVTVTNAGTIGTDQANCGAFTPAPLTSVADGVGAGIIYQWQYSINNTTFSNIAGATATTYTPAGAITQTTYYRRVATSGGNSYNSNVITAAVNPVPVVTVTPTSTVIALGMTQTLTANGANTYVWSPSATLSSPNGAAVIATPPAGSITYTVTGTIAATGCNAQATTNITVIDPGTIAGTQVNCGAFTPAAFTSLTNASGVAGITYQWQSSADNITFVNVTGATAASYAPARANANTVTYYRRVATGAGQSYNSNVLSVTANAIPAVTIAPTAATVTIGFTQTFTASGADTYSWTPSTYLSATNTAGVLAQPTAAGTVTYTVTGTINATGCSGTASVALTAISPGSLLPGTVGSPQTICANATPAAFTSTAASGGTGAISYQWQMSTDNVTFTNIPSATAATYSAGALTQTTYYRRGASTANDAVVYTPSVKVNVIAKPVIAGGISGVCAMPKDTVKTFSVTAAPNATHYVWALPATGGWSGSSTTNTINVKAGTTNGVIAVTPYNNTCAGSQVTYNVSIIDYAAVTISGTPVSASGTNNNAITVKIQLIDVLGNLIGCSGGTATLCSNGGTFTNVVDNGDGTYTSYLVSTADQITICGSVAGVPISNTTKVNFTGPQGGITSNGPIFDFETPTITFTATDGRAPFTVIYHSDKAAAGKNDTLKNAISGTAYPVAKIPSTTLYTLVKVIDANGEVRDRKFNRDTTTTRVVIPKVIITLKADPARKEPDSTWATRIVVHTKNIGDLDLANSQARLNLKDVFPSPVTYVLDSVKVSGRTVVQNPNYDGVINSDLFAKLRRSPVYNNVDMQGMAPDGTAREEVWNNDNDETVVRVGDDGHSIYMFGPQSNLPVGEDATIILWLHVKPNGYSEPFVMQAVALGTGHTDGATSLTTSLSNDNDNVSEHPEVTKVGDPVPAVINLFPTASVGVSLNAGTPVLQGNGTYNVLLTYKLRNYGNVNLRNVKLTQNLLSSILSPSVFNVVSPVTATGGMVVNPSFNAKTDTNMLAVDNILGYKQESTLSYTINITPNQLSAVYRLQAMASGYSDDLLTTVTDLSTDGAEPDPDGNNIPSEKVITTIVINTPVPPLTPGSIGIKEGSSTVNQKGYCGSAVNVEVVTTAAPAGGLDAYQYQWQSSADNITFRDIVGAETADYTTGTISSSVYLRRATISGSQVKYTNSVYLQIYPTPATPVITGTGTMVTGKGNITLTSPAATTYLWSTGATTRSITVTDAGNYTVTIGDANGCTAVSTAYAITSLEPGKVADVQKILSQAPQLQQDGSFLLTFNVVAANLRSEALDSVKITDDLTKVFPSAATFSIVDIKASGGLMANPSYDGRTNTSLLSDVSKLPALKKDSVQFTIKVFPNGFSGVLNNVATLLAKSPLGSVVVASNDPVGNSDPSIRLPTKFTLPSVDIFIPSGFSPNRDGYNDKFVITRPYNTTIRMEIYNRWSNLVYKSLDYKNEWEGKGNQANRVMGEDLPDGTYYYEILAVNNSTGQVRKFVGYITLKR